MLGLRHWGAALTVILASGCGASAIAPPTTPPRTTDAIPFGTGSHALCDDKGNRTPGDLPREIDLMGAWNDRALLANLYRQGIVAVRYRADGCTLKLEVLPNCTGGASYEFRGQYMREGKLIRNQSELSAKLPLAVAELEGWLSGERSLQANYVVAGVASIPPSVTYRRADLMGQDCARATHIVSTLFLGGFSLTTVENNMAGARAGVPSIGAGAGAQGTSSMNVVREEISTEACDASRADGELHRDCDKPLRVGLSPLAAPPTLGCRGFEACDASCKSGDARSCVMVGFIYLGDGSTAPDYTRAYEMFERACNENDLVGCVQQAMMHESGMGMPADPQTAVSMYWQSCQNGEPTGCERLGFAHLKGIGAVQDNNRALDFFDQACQTAGLRDSCMNVVYLAKFLCQQNNGTRCSQLGSYTYMGVGTAIDKVEGLRLYERGCELGDAQGCRGAGMMYREGDGVMQDLGRAHQLFRLACDRNDGDSCGSLGDMFESGEGVPTDYPQAVKLFERSCGLGSYIGCMELAGSYEQGETGLTKDLERAHYYYDAACQVGYQDACTEAQQLVPQ
jgi:TPR repeat protein